MSSVATMMALGLPGATAESLVGTVATGLTGAGTTSADALQLAADANLFTTVASGTGAKLQNAPDKSTIRVFNGGANALLVYPPTGQQLNNKTASTGTISIAANKGGAFIKLNATHWGAISD